LYIVILTIILLKGVLEIRRKSRLIKPGYPIGGGGGTAVPKFSNRAGLYLHPI